MGLYTSDACRKRRRSSESRPNIDDIVTKIKSSEKPKQKRVLLKSERENVLKSQIDKSIRWDSEGDHRTHELRLLNELERLEASVQKLELTTNTNAHMLKLVMMHRDRAMNDYEKYLLHDDRTK